MLTTCLSTGEEVFVLRFAGEAVMVEFAALLTLAPFKVATFQASLLILCAQVCARRKILQREHVFLSIKQPLSGGWHPDQNLYQCHCAPSQNPKRTLSRVTLLLSSKNPSPDMLPYVIPNPAGHVNPDDRWVRISFVTEPSNDFTQLY